MDTPSLPKPTSQPLPRTNKKIRLSSSSGGQHDLDLPLNVTYSQLQDAIHKELGIIPKDQKIRYGFPPRLLQPPEESKEQEPIPIQHGDRITVEVLPPPQPIATFQGEEEMQEDNVKGFLAGATSEEGVDKTKESIEETNQASTMDGKQ